VKVNTQATDKSEQSCFLVCGLGRLGQHCVSVLKEFDVIVNAINVTDNPHWEIPELLDLIDRLIIGDCRQPKVLQQANIEQYRAVLIVTSDQRVNIEAAFTIRRLNPYARLVVRSDQESLNELLQEHLGNYIAFEASQLPATAFALAALGGEIQGFFTLEHSVVRVVNVQIHDKHRWCNIRLLHELNSFNQRILTHNGHTTADVDFYEWEPDSRLVAGDTVTYIEITGQVTSVSTTVAKANRRQFWQEIIGNLELVRLKGRLQQVWQSIHQNQTQQVAILSAGIMVSLFLLGTVLYKLQYPHISIQDALNVSLVLAIGGYDNLFGQLKLPFPIPWWLHLYSISLTVGGTVFVGIFYAMLTERVLSTRFQLLKRRPPIPRQDHVVLIGLGRLGRRVAKLLQDLNQPLVAIHSSSTDADVLPELPLVIDHSIPGLMKANIATAKSVMVLTDDEVANLEIGLRTSTMNSVANLVIRTFDPLFTKNISRLLPHARILQAYPLAAEAFAGSAFVDTPTPRRCGILED
jgi:Trk K+ transport system NAD-binding subunit